MILKGKGNFGLSRKAHFDIVSQLLQYFSSHSWMAGRWLEVLPSFETSF